MQAKIYVKILDLAIYALAIISGFAAFVATIVWFVSRLAELEGSETPFSLAQISATLGGLLLVGWFVEKRANTATGTMLATAAKLFLISTLAFTALGMVLPVVRGFGEDQTDFQFWVVSTATVFGLASFTFAAGIGVTILILPRLKWKLPVHE